MIGENEKTPSVEGVTRLVGIFAYGTGTICSPAAEGL